MTLLDADKHSHLDTVGEDTCELYLSIERSFGVDLGSWETLADLRVSELAERICEHAKFPTKEKCLSAVVFYKLRQGLEDLFGVAPRSMRPSTPLRCVMPWWSRRTRWRAMQERLGVHFPGLLYPGWLLLLTLVAPLMLLLCLKEFLGVRIGWSGVIGHGLVFAPVMILACIPFARSFPLGCETIGDLAKAVLAQNYAMFARHGGGSTEEDALFALRTLVAAEAGIPLADVLPETRIPADLNMY